MYLEFYSLKALCGLRYMQRFFNFSPIAHVLFRYNIYSPVPIFMHNNSPPIRFVLISFDRKFRFWIENLECRLLNEDGKSDNYWTVALNCLQLNRSIRDTGVSTKAPKILASAVNVCSIVVQQRCIVLRPMHTPNICCVYVANSAHAVGSRYTQSWLETVRFWRVSVSQGYCR